MFHLIKQKTLFNWKMNKKLQKKFLLSLAKIAGLFVSGQDSKKLEFAKSSLEFLVDEINLGSQSVEIYNPEGWVIVSWSNEMPLSCSNLGYKSCICICDDVGLISKGLSNLPFTKSQREKLKENCDEKGICMNNENSFIVKGEFIKIDEPPIIIKIEDKILK